MRVFVTGANGFVGSAVVQELIGAGHAVLGLARTDVGAAIVAKLGATVLRGGLEDLDVLRRGATESDGVIHTAFIHDFSNFAASCAVDKRAIETLGEVLAGSNRPLISTSGVAQLAQGRAATEDDKPVDHPQYPRVSEKTAMSFAARGVRAMTVRLAPSVHGDSEQGPRAGFVSMLIAMARQGGLAGYVGDGLNRWAGVHRLDAARLYRLALEKGTAGAAYHGIADEGVPMKEIAGVIGRRLNVPVKSLTPEEAAAHFTWMAPFAAMDMAASSAKTKAALGWQPMEPGLLADLDRPRFFES